MKKIIVAFALLVGHSFYGQAQTINNKNYYSFQKDGGSLNWLHSCDAIPIIIEELLKNDIAYHTISVGELIKVNDSTRFVVTVSFEKGDKECGFLYEASHGYPLNPKDRDFLTNRKKAYYVQAEKDTKNKVNFTHFPATYFFLKKLVIGFNLI